ncbi:MAG: 10 kDa chaperonin [Nitrospira sp.]|nr:MAG: 10 kDa chaperonin [Nitrospira sp.]
MKLTPLQDWVLIRSGEPPEKAAAASSSRIRHKKNRKRDLYKKYAAREVDGDDKELVLVREEDVLGSLR